MSSTEVATTNNGSTAMAQYTQNNNPFAKLADKLNVGSDFLQFSGKTGDFTFGDKKEELEHGAFLQANMLQVRDGWICWKEGSVVEEIMVNILEGAPPRQDQLTDHGPYKKYDDDTEDGWQAQMSIQFRDDETGAQYLYKTSSSSGKRAIGALAKDYSNGFKTNVDADGVTLTPVVEISANPFTLKNNPRVGTLYAPVFKIVEWKEANANEALPVGGENPEDYDDEPTKTIEAAVTTRGKGKRTRKF